MPYSLRKDFTDDTALLTSLISGFDPASHAARDNIRQDMGTYSDETDVDQLCDQGDVEHEAGRWTQASTHYKRALEFGAAQLSPERHIYVRMALALCFFYSGSYEDAVKYDRATLKILEAGPENGTNHKDAVDTRYRLARALVESASKSDRRRSEKWEEAVTFYKKNIRVADKEASLEARKGLASVCVKLRRYSEAKDIYEQLLDEEESNFLNGKDDESLELKHEYAAVQYHLERYDQSKRLFSQIEETISSLPNSRKRNLGRLSQGVDKYLAACFEATLDLDRGVARSVAATKERKGSTPVPVKQSPAKVAPNQPRQSIPAPVAAGGKTSGSKQRAGPNDDAAASVDTRRQTSGISEKPQKDSNDTVSSTGKRSSKTDSSPLLAGPSKSTPNLSVLSSAAHKTRRSSSDHSVTRSREAVKSEIPVTRSRSEHSPSMSKCAAKSELSPKSAAKLRPEASSSIYPSDSESRSKSVASPLPENNPLQSQMRSNTIDSGSRPQSAASLCPEKYSPHSSSKSKDTSDSESKSKPVPSLHPKSKVTDSSDSESRTPQSKPRSVSDNKSSRSASESTRPSHSKSEPSHSPFKPFPPSETRTHLASESTASSNSKIQTSDKRSTNSSDSESRPSHSPKGTSDSKPRTSRPTLSSSSESNRNAVASRNLEQTSSNDNHPHKEHLRDNLERLHTSEPHRSRSVSAPSTSGTSSAKSAGAIESADQPSRRSRAQAKVPQVVISKPSITFQVPGSWPEDSSGSATHVQETKGLALLEPKNGRHSLDDDTVASLASSRDVPKLERSRSVTCAPSETGKLYALPKGAPEVDNWFRELRHHTHRLLYNKEPKNPGRKPVRVAIIDSGLAGDCNDPKVPMAGQSRRKIRKGHFTYKDFTGDNSSCTDSREDLHGTLCASFLMQVAPHAELYVANVVQRKKEGQEAAHVAKAIKWAIEQEVDIISMSFGWKYEKPEVSKQIDLARGKGILLFAAASNDGPFTPEYGVYPASHHSVYCIYSCGGSGKSSEFNPPVTKIAASFMLPGEHLAVLEADHRPVAGSVRHNGTSFATPIAAGTAAMILDLARHELKDSAEVERRLKDITGMTAVFQAMSADALVDGLYHVKPWKLLGERKPIESLSNPNITHKWFTLLKVLEHLQSFGAYERPLA